MTARSTVQIPTRVIDRFFLKVQVKGENECWPWLKSVGSHGYGQVGWSEHGHTYVTTAHRVSWASAFGPIETGFTVRQKCQNLLCQNPGHLELISTQEANWTSASNNRDKTRCPQGHPYAGANLIRLGNERRCPTCALTHRHELARRVRALNGFYRRFEHDLELDTRERESGAHAAA